MTDLEVCSRTTAEAEESRGSVGYVTEILEPGYKDDGWETNQRCTGHMNSPGCGKLLRLTRGNLYSMLVDGEFMTCRVFWTCVCEKEHQLLSYNPFGDRIESREPKKRGFFSLT